MRKYDSIHVGAGVLATMLFLAGCSGNGPEAGFVIPDGPRGEVVSAALSQIGTRYEYGASKPGRALDCSALTRHAYRSAGFEIPRMSRAQHRAAKPVSPARRAPGDLVFFRTGDGYHVGVLVDDDRFVHASTSSKQVKVSSLVAPYWRSRMVGAGTFMK